MWSRSAVRGLIAIICLPLLTAAVRADVSEPVNITVEEDSPARIVLQYGIGDYASQSVTINGEKYALLALGDESLSKVAGAPALPTVCRSVIIPDDAEMEVRVLSANFTEIAGIDVAPSKGFILRTENPADVPYAFGPEYESDDFYPPTVATLREPYILRDQRGVVVELNPLRNNPVTHTLRVYTDVTLEIANVGPGKVNVLDRRPEHISLAFHGIYQHHFLNYGMHSRYTPLDEDGDMLIIAHDAWIANVQPLAAHKNMRGIDTTIVGVSSIGNNSTAIQNYIQSVYDSGDLAFVLLVGDAAQVATPYASGGSSDPTYSKLAGGDDYPDIMVGRFSAETAAQVDTQVQRTITYETLPATSQDWFWRGMGVASNQGPGDDDEYDNEHIGYIRDDLLAYGYTEVDQIYDPSGTAAQVSAGLNEGRGIINYCGHGSTTSWSSTGFSNSNVDALTNDNMLPFICSVACVNGQFDGYTCFAEAWLRATHNDVPSGAIGAYMSSINQSWDPPMDAQDEFVDMFVAEAYSTLGTLLYGGSCHMMDEYGSGGVSMFDTWHLFGDPSLRVVMSCTDTGTLMLDSGKYACEDVATIQVVDCGLNLDDGVVDTAEVTIVSDTEPAGEIVTLTELGSDTGQFEGTITLSASNSAGVLQVGADDNIAVTYNDADDGTGSPAVVTSNAVVDCTPPTILDVEVVNIEPRSATVLISADEVIRGEVYFGPACDDLPYDANGGYGDPAAVGLSGLQDASTYYFKLVAEDEAGNMVVDDNNGMCYMFSTPDIPDFFTELFESGNDLADLTLLFVPNGTVDFYAGCAEEIDELPTDPAGGTTISLADDDYETINIGGGESVLLYGTSYSTFYVSSNGYITFGSGDTDYTEDLADHFSQPRIAGLYDDLNPSSGGTVSWKQEADRVVVTYLNVYEYGTTNPNTFQIEMFFNGDITISYLAVSVSDGLAGLSEGVGLDPDYYPSDLSNMGSCGPRPPTAVDGEVTTPANWPVTIDLVATDDGLPEPPTLDLIIGSLPEYGTLADPGAGAIDAVPYTLVSGGNQVIYTPDDWYMGDDYFQFYAFDGGVEPEGGNSNIAAIVVHVTAPAPEPQLSFTFDTDPGWTTEGEWEFGLPLGGGSHNDDPISGYTGNNVYGYNLAGDYVSNMPVYYLTSTAIDCSDLLLTELHFMRWLGVERTPYDHATVEISTDGGTWAQLWANGTTTIADTEWVEMVFDISEYADDAATVYLRWSMGPTDGGTTYPGWNIDDVAIWGVNTATPCPGDLDGDGDVDLSDLAALLANYGTTGGASYEDGDLDGDGDVDLSDLATLLAVYGTTC